MYEKSHSESLNDHKDIIEHLRRELAKTRDDLETKESDLSDLNLLKSNSIEQLKSEFTQRENSLLSELTQLKEDNSYLKSKLDAVQVYMREKVELETRMSELRSEMEEMRELHVQDVRSLEKKSLFEKDKLRNEMFERLNELAYTIRVDNYKQMSENSWRAANETRAVNRDLTRLSSQLADENRVLKEKIGELMAEKSSFREIERDMSRKCVTLEKELNFTSRRILALEQSQSSLNLTQTELDRLKNEKSTLEVKVSSLEW